MQVVGRTEFEHVGEVVRQLVLGDLEAGLLVGLLDRQQGHAPLPGVPVREVREVEAAAPPRVERLHVFGADGLRVLLLQPPDGLQEVRGNGVRERAGQLLDEAEAVDDLVVRVADEPRGRQPRRPHLVVRERHGRVQSPGRRGGRPVLPLREEREGDEHVRPPPAWGTARRADRDHPS
jgi:hypothetical protein